MNFIRNNGEVVPVNSKEVSKLEETEKYTLYGARHNPSGEQMVSVVYKNGHTVGDMMNADGDSGIMVDLSEEEEKLEEMPMMGEIRNNPSVKITWKNLRLQSAIEGTETVRAGTRTRRGIRGFRNIVSAITGGTISSGDSLRDTPMLFMAKATDWYDYITNMTTVDIGSEFAAGVSHAQRAGNALFAAEWQADPNHQNLAGRLMPGGDLQDATRKGQIAYDVLTRGRDILSQQGYGANNQEIMHKLVSDIIRSMPIKQYNFYTLYNLHVDEGDKIYREFQSRYIPLDTAEVEMVLEMQRYLDAEGDAYAFRTTTNEEQGVLSSKMMRSAVMDYEVGDTVSVRTILRALRDPPYNYRPRAVVVSSASGSVGSALRTQDNQTSTYLELEVVNRPIIQEMVRIGAGRQTSDKKVGVWVLGVEEHHLQDKNKNQIDNRYTDRYETLQIVMNQHNPTPQYLAVRATGGRGSGGNRWTIVDYAEDYLKSTRQDATKKARSIRQGLGKSDDKKSGGGGYKGKKPRGNPKGAGRGKLHHIEIWPKTQITMKRREPAPGRAKGETRHGAGKLGKQGQTYWTKGVSKHLPAAQRLQMGTLKRTGEPAPYRIRFPTSYFAIRFNEKLGYMTLEPKKEKKNKAFIKAWKEFTKFYGVPKHMPSKDTYNRFIIPKDEMLQSPYFQEVRAAAGKK